MKIAFLTSTKNRHLYFAARMLSEFPDSIVICQPKNVPSDLSVGKRIKYRFESYLNEAKQQVRDFRQRRAIQEAYNRYACEKDTAEREYFEEPAERYQSYFQDRTYVVNANINHPFVGLLLENFNPDIICVMGTALVKSKIFRMAKHAFNLHTGISPQYRGSASNMWPLVFGQPQYVGVTIHSLSAKIDGGDIVYHGRPKVEIDDNFGKLNAKSIVLGSELMVQTIRDYDSGELYLIPQWQGGRLLLSKDWKLRILLEYRKQMDSGLLHRYIDEPECFSVDKRYRFENVEYSR